LLLAACVSEDIATGDAEIVSGADAPGSAWDAVGSLSDAIGNFCTGTLIAPSLVLSARHCVHGPSIWRGEITFNVGSNARAPKRTVVVDGAAKAPLDGGGWISLGSDVALFHLAEPISNVRPIPVFREAWAEHEIGSKVRIVGYGRQAQDQLAVEGAYGTRKTGLLTLQAVRGRALDRAFPTFDAFRTRIETLEGKPVDEADRVALEKAYAYTLLDGYEVFIGLGEGDAQNCHGDSGGPLFHGDGASRTIGGVLSGGIIVSGTHCRGGFYATFGPRALEMIDAALACEGAPGDAPCDDAMWSQKIAPGKRPVLDGGTDAARTLDARRDG